MHLSFEAAHARRKGLRALRLLDAQGLPAWHADTSAVVTIEDLARHRALVRAEASRLERSLVADLGCGSSRYVARIAAECGLGFVGIDSSPTAIAQLSNSVASNAALCRFEVRHFTDTGLAGASVGICFSFDALYLAPDRRAALSEVGRILRRGGMLDFTVFYAESIEARRLVICNDDWQDDLQATGFTNVRRMDLTSTWRTAVRAKHVRRLRCADALQRALGAAVEPDLAVSRTWLKNGGRLINSVRREEIQAVHLG